MSLPRNLGQDELVGFRLQERSNDADAAVTNTDYAEKSTFHRKSGRFQSGQTNGLIENGRTSGVSSQLGLSVEERLGHRVILT